MKLSFPVTLLLFTISAAAQQSSSGDVHNYSLEGNSFIDALLKISAQFEFPLGVEWVKSADALKPVRFSQSHTTVKEIIQAVVSMHAGYDWRNEDGIVHVFQSELAKNSHNPLNVNIKSPVSADTVGMMNNILFQMVRHEVRLPELQGIAGSVPGYPGEAVFSFAVENGPARKILNQIITSGIRTIPVKMQRIWIATFPEKPASSRTGFLEVVPMLNQNVVSAQDQPFWILLRWGDPPLENMIK